MNLIPLKFLLYVLPLMFLTACGGGGSGSSTKTSDNPIPIYDFKCTDDVSLASQMIGIQGWDASDPIYICSAEDFKNINTVPDALNRHYVLMTDLKIENHVPVGGGVQMFTGSFDGNGHTIEYTLTDPVSPETEVGGLFGVVSGTIQNLKVKGDIDETSSWAIQIGGVVGAHISGVVRNVSFEGSIHCIGTSFCGGIVGESKGKMVNVHSDVVLTCETADYGRDSGICEIGTLAGSFSGEAGSGQSYGMGSIDASSPYTSFVGGLFGVMAGYSVSGFDIPSIGSLQNSVAMVSSLINRGCGAECIFQASQYGRVYGYTPNEPGETYEPITLINNYAFENMMLTTTMGSTTDWLNAGPETANGEGVSLAETQNEDWWKNTLRWAGGCDNEEQCPDVWGGQNANPEKPWKWDPEKKRPVLWFE